MTLRVWNTTSEPTPFHLNTSAWEWNGGEPHPNTTSDGLLCPQVQVCIELYWDCLVGAIPLPTFVAAWQLVWQWPPQGWTGTRNDRNWNAHGWQVDEAKWTVGGQNHSAEAKAFLLLICFSHLFSATLTETSGIKKWFLNPRDQGRHSRPKLESAAESSYNNCSKATSQLDRHINSWRSPPEGVPVWQLQ